MTLVVSMFFGDIVISWHLVAGLAICRLPRCIVVAGGYAARAPPVIGFALNTLADSCDWLLGTIGAGSCGWL